MKCLTCQQITQNPKFCSQSCSASYNNRKVRRHGKPPEKRNCMCCQKEFVVAASDPKKYCSIQCAVNHTILKYKTPEEKKEVRKKGARKWSSTYRAKHQFILDPTADKNIIDKIYNNTPCGFHVDHIIPLTRGGKHHQDNLQYLLASDNHKKNNKLEEECNFPLTIITWKEVFEAIEYGWIENGEQYV